MAVCQDVWTQTDASYDPAMERLIRLWLLDAAVQQFNYHRTPKHKNEAWLPDSVFPDPGMSEDEMVDFMESRGASRSCIQYARMRFEESNEKVLKDVKETNKRSNRNEERNDFEHKRGYKPIDFLINPVRAFHRFFKHMKTKKGGDSKFLVPNDTLHAFPVSLVNEESHKETRSV